MNLKRWLVAVILALPVIASVALSDTSYEQISGTETGIITSSNAAEVGPGTFNPEEAAALCTSGSSPFPCPIEPESVVGVLPKEVYTGKAVTLRATVTSYLLPEDSPRFVREIYGLCALKDPNGTIVWNSTEEYQQSAPHFEEITQFDTEEECNKVCPEGYVCEQKCCQKVGPCRLSPLGKYSCYNPETCEVYEGGIKYTCTITRTFDEPGEWELAAAIGYIEKEFNDTKGEWEINTGIDTTSITTLHVLNIPSPPETSPSILQDLLQLFFEWFRSIRSL